MPSLYFADLQTPLFERMNKDDANNIWQQHISETIVHFMKLFPFNDFLLNIFLLVSQLWIVVSLNIHNRNTLTLTLTLTQLNPNNITPLKTHPPQ